MRFASLVLVIVSVLPSLKMQGQSLPVTTPPSHVPLDLPTGRRGYKPKISLQIALKIAEDYISKEHISVSNGWLSEARIILYGDGVNAKKKTDPNWLFVWISDEGHIDVMVSMNGEAMLLPSM